MSFFGFLRFLSTGSVPTTTVLNITNNRDIINALPLDNTAGSNLGNGYVSTAASYGMADWLAYFDYQPGQKSAGFLSFAANKIGLFLTGTGYVTYSTIYPNIDQFNFIPRNSSIGLPLTNLSENLTLSTTSALMPRTHFDAFMGWRSWYTKNYYTLPFGYTYTANNQHLNLNNMLYHKKDSALIINKDVGFDTTYLENLNLNRKADFKAYSNLTASNANFKTYLYPDTVISVANLDSMIYSKNNKVEITDKGDVRFFAKDAINLNYGFEADSNSRFETMIDSFLLCTTPDSILQQGMNPPLPIKDNNSNDGSGQLKVYPNPSSGQFNLVLDLGYKPININYCIYNLEGKIVLGDNIKTNGESDNIIPLTETLQKGFYILKITQQENNHQTYFKIMKL